MLGPTLEQSEVDGVNAILAALAGWPLSWVAYGLGTAYHETAHTMQPVREIGSDAYLTRMYDPCGLRPKVAARLGNVEPGDGVKYCGRGYPQLTGRANYARADRELTLGGTLLAHPDNALRPDLAAEIMEAGMREGWFTGKRCVDYLPTVTTADRAAFIAARRIINGQDRAGLIADYALSFQDALLLGRWA